jgi:hypothetical protein
MAAAPITPESAGSLIGLLAQGALIAAGLAVMLRLTRWRLRLLALGLFLALAAGALAGLWPR